MEYISVAEASKKWGVSERSVRGYCAEGKIDGAFLTGKTWNIPETAEKPDRINKKTDAPKTLLEVLKTEKTAKLHGGIYHKIQIDLTYNSNHILSFFLSSAFAWSALQVVFNLRLLIQYWRSPPGSRPPTMSMNLPSFFSAISLKSLLSSF